MDFGFRRADRVIVHGRGLVKIVNEEIKIANDRIDVVPHVLIGGTQVEKTVEEDENSILFFGRIWEYKGLEYLIKSEPLISQQLSGVQITIAGEGEEFDRYRQWMINPERFIVHNAWVSDEERVELFQRAALVVLPYTSATQSGVVPIAYMYGKPVVATRVGALPEYVEHGRTGLLVPTRDERALADAILYLLRNGELRHWMGENGRRKLHEECAPDGVAQSTIGVYERAIQDRKHLRIDRIK